MARQNALSIYVDNSTLDKLAETYGAVIEAIQKGAVSEQIKNKNYSGDPTSGTVEIDRFKNAQVAALGTARTASAGEKLKNTGKVVISVDTDKEIVEEIAKKDLKLYGIAGIAERRKSNHIKRMIAYLDTQFFATAVSEGTALTGITDTKIEDILETLIQSVETTQNDWVDGVDRDQLVLVVKPSVYGKIRNYIDIIDGSSGSTAYFHGVRLFSNHRQTKDAICMIDGAVAQLVTTDQYAAEKIPLSNDIALELFFSKGTKAVMPDLIKYISTVSADRIVDVNVTNNPLITQEATTDDNAGGDNAGGGNNASGGDNAGGGNNAAG